MTQSIPNVLASRYASAKMRTLWSPEHKIVLERQLWIAVMRAQRTLGIDVPEDVIAAYEAVADQVDLASIDARERVTRHDDEPPAFAEHAFGRPESDGEFLELDGRRFNGVPYGWRAIVLFPTIDRTRHLGDRERSRPPRSFSVAKRSVERPRVAAISRTASRS